MIESLLNSVWPAWRIIRELGRGSYGSVYEAVREEGGVTSRAAIKIITIPPEQSQRADDLVNEIRLMESLKGTQNIVSVEDYAITDDADGGRNIIIRMELLTPFLLYIANRNLSVREILKLGTDICSALDLCARRGIIHSDIKPENIFVNDFGDFKLGDFGGARRINDSGDTSNKGTYNYMAPEVAKGAVPDQSADLYSLGIVMYRFLNGNRLPFIKSNADMTDTDARRRAVEKRLSGKKIPPPEFASKKLSKIILRAIDPNPNKRYTSAQEMRSDLMAQINDQYKNNYEDDLDKTVSVRQAPTAPAPQNNAYVNASPRKKSSTPIIIAIIIALTVIAVVAIIVLGGKDKKSDSKSSKSKTEETSDEKDDEKDDDKDEDEDKDDDKDKDEDADESSDDDEDSESSGHISRAEYDKMIKKFANKYSNYKILRGSKPTDFIFVDAEEGDVPVLIIANGQAVDIVTLEEEKTGSLAGQLVNSLVELKYCPRKNVFLYHTRSVTNYTLDMYRYCTKDPKGYYFNNNDECAEIYDVDGVIRYDVETRKDTDEEVFNDFMKRYGELVNISLEYDDMYRSIEEAGNAYWDKMYGDDEE